MTTTDETNESPLYTQYASSSAEVELRRLGDELSLYFIDAHGSQWEEELDSASSFKSKDDLVYEIRREIETAAEELAKSIVENALERSNVLPELAATVAEKAGADG